MHYLHNLLLFVFFLLLNYYHYHLLRLPSFSFFFLFFFFSFFLSCTSTPPLSSLFEYHNVFFTIHIEINCILNCVFYSAPFPPSDRPRETVEMTTQPRDRGGSWSDECGDRSPSLARWGSVAVQALRKQRISRKESSDAKREVLSRFFSVSISVSLWPPCQNQSNKN